MWQAFRNGSAYDLSTSETRSTILSAAPLGPGTDRARPGDRPAPAQRSARAARPRLVPELRGVQISGTLDLAGGTVTPYVELRRCRFENEVLLPEAHFTTLRLVDCSIPRLEAARVRTEGDLHLPRCRFESGIRLTDAQIGTDLLINQTTSTATGSAGRSPPTA